MIDRGNVDTKYVKWWLIGSILLAIERIHVETSRGMNKVRKGSEYQQLVQIHTTGTNPHNWYKGLWWKSQMQSVFIKVTIALMQHYDQKAIWRENALLLLCFLITAKSSKELRTGFQTGQESGGRNRYRGRRGCCVTGLLLLTCLA